jgi:hypothetical protein
VPTGDPDNTWLICGELPHDAEKSQIYAFNKADGKVHMFKSFGGIREEGQGEVWELLAENMISIYDLK